MTYQDDAAPWWKGAVIYQIYPRSFADANGDGVGDLRGISSRLEYVASLGVDAIWLSPIFQSPMKDFGYDVSDYRAIDPLFGTLEDFDALVQHAHALGLKVLIDQVLSHTSDQHPWFIQSRAQRAGARADWYVWADAQADGSPPNNWRSVFGGPAWSWDTRRKQYYLHNFLPSQPDLNFHNPAVQEQVLQDMEFWLRRGVDGFRLDTTNYFHHDALLRSNPAQDVVYTPQNLPANPYDMQQHLFDKNRPENLLFLEKVRTLLDRHGAASVGEVGDVQALHTMIAYTSGGKRLHMTYSFSFLNREREAAYVRRHALEFEEAAAGKGSWPCWTFGNHDSTRLMTRWDGGADPAFVRMCMASLFSMRGSACWYQGDELALPEADLPFEALQDPPGIAMWPEYKGRDGCRTPLPWNQDLPHAGFSAGSTVRPWLPVPPEHVALAVDVHERQPQAPLHFMRSFLAWRKEHRVLMEGGIEFLPEHAQVLAFVRRAPAQERGMLCVFNFTPRRAEIALPGCALPQTVEVPGLPPSQYGQVQGPSLVLPAWGVAYLWTKG